MQHEIVRRRAIAVAVCLVGVSCGGRGAPVDGGTDGTATDVVSQDADAAVLRDTSTVDRADVTTSDDAADVPFAMDAATDVATDGPNDAGAVHWVSGYYVGYQRDAYPSDAIDWSALTHIMIGPVVPNADGSLDTTFDIDPTNGPMFAHDVVTRAHANGRLAVAMLGGAGVHSGWVGAASDANRATFVANLVQLVSDYQLDGLDLDWEPLDVADQPSFRALAQSLRTSMPHLVLTIPVGWQNANAATVDPFYAAIAPLFDQMNIMTYGMAGAWSGWKSWHSAALTGETSTTPSSIASSVTAYLTAGVPASKLGFGIGFYGQCWSPPVDAPGMSLGGASVLADDNVMTYSNIVTNYLPLTTRAWDSNAQVPYLGFASATGPQGCTFVSYDDPQSIAAKGQWLRTQGLGGIIIWTIAEGYVASAPSGARDPLLEAVRAAFLP